MNTARRHMRNRLGAIKKKTDEIHNDNYFSITTIL
jgi:hypothetical protein